MWCDVYMCNVCRMFVCVCGMCDACLIMYNELSVELTVLHTLIYLHCAGFRTVEPLCLA